MEKKSIIKNTSFIMTTKISQFFAGLIKTKISALLIGPVGVGVFSQFSTITSKMNILSTLEMNSALVKQIAETNSNSDQRGSTQSLAAAIKLYITIIAVMSSILSIVMFIFRNKLTVFVFGDANYNYYFILCIVSFPLLVYDSISVAILQGFKGINYLSYARIIIILINLIIFIPFIYFGKLTGAILFFPSSFIFTLFINYFFAYKYFLKPRNISLWLILRQRYALDYFKEYSVFAGVGLFAGSYSIISDLACRSLVVNNLGIDQLGIYSPNVTWANLFVGFFLPGIHTYLYPRFCEVSKDKCKVNNLLNDALRISSFAIAPLILLIVPLRNIFLPLFYSNKFINAGQFMPFHFVGTLFYVWWYVHMLVFTPSGKIKLHGILMMIFSSLDIFIVYLFTPLIGMWGWMLKFMVSPVISLIVYNRILAHQQSFSISRLNLKLMLYLLANGLIVIALIAKLNKPIIEIAFGIISGLILILFLTPNERSIIANSINTILRKLKMK